MNSALTVPPPFVSRLSQFGRFMARGSHLLEPADGLTWRPRMLERREQIMSAYRTVEKARMSKHRDGQLVGLQQLVSCESALCL